MHVMLSVIAVVNVLSFWRKIFGGSLTGDSRIWPSTSIKATKQRHFINLIQVEINDKGGITSIRNIFELNGHSFGC
jgi:hypothetical protein